MFNLIAFPNKLSQPNSAQMDGTTQEHNNNSIKNHENFVILVSKTKFDQKKISKRKESLRMVLPAN